MPTEVPTVSASPTPVPTPSPTTIAEYINSLVPDDSHPIVGNFLVANANGSLRTVYLLNKNYAGNVKVKFDDYTYSSNITVTNLLKKVQYELASVTNSAGTVNVMRKNSADSWTVEFLQTGVKYYFSGRSKDNIYNSPYGIIIAEGNTLEHIIITTN